MRIGLDLNDVIRGYTRQFAKIYREKIDHEFDVATLNVNDEDFSKVFPFKTKEAYNNFKYVDYPFEVCGMASPMDNDTMTQLIKWTETTIPDLDEDSEIELEIISTMEYALTVQATYHFLSKCGCRIRRVFMPLHSEDTWKECDAIITASPNLLGKKPEGKVSVKIDTTYNLEAKSDFAFSSFYDFASAIDNTKKLIEKIKNK